MTNDELKKSRIGRVDECDGKTIAAADYTCAEGFIMRFTDGTWLAATVPGCDICDADLDFHAKVNSVDLHGVGLLNAEEYKIAYQAEEDAETARQRREYERLKKQFEGHQ